MSLLFMRACLSLMYNERHISALQRHYAVLQALALEEDDMPEVNDETVPDEEGMARYDYGVALSLFFKPLQNSTA